MARIMADHNVEGHVRGVAAPVDVSRHGGRCGRVCELEVESFERLGLPHDTSDRESVAALPAARGRLAHGEPAMMKGLTPWKRRFAP